MNLLLLIPLLIYTVMNLYAIDVFNKAARRRQISLTELLFCTVCFPTTLAGLFVIASGFIWYNWLANWVKRIPEKWNKTISW